MAIGLGRTISNPTFLLLQMLHAVSLFFVMLGVARVVLGMAELSMGAAASAETRALPIAKGGLMLPGIKGRPYTAPEDTAQQALQPLYELRKVVSRGANVLDLPREDALFLEVRTTGPPAASLSFLELLSYCFHVPLASLFAEPLGLRRGSTAEGQKAPTLAHLEAFPNGLLGEDIALPEDDDPIAERLRGESESRFYLQHLFAALLCAYPLAALLQRRKLVLDFVLTIYVSYWLLTNIILQRLLGGGLRWWASCVLGMSVMYAATYVLCRRKELQEVRLSGGGAAATGAGVPPTTTMWLKDCRGEDDLIGEEMRVIFRETPRPNALGGCADAHGNGSPHDAAGRARFPAPAPSTNNVKAIAVDGSRPSEEVIHKHKAV
ncbi:hypothetical protein LSCM1_04456 [Leishmania martiniquensis]|uniref:Uncharacterized protein n=1 Tax=Leishmania martiniquensis TaxID=1580590 RepID=A0A836KKD8_9TRYP|nr:hypothetical protein LSCM1_04456 [Leishmania martiniquensis]